MPPAVVEEVCTITVKGQTTVPKAVRQALGVGYGGALPPGEDEAAAEDPALAPFLALLEADLAARPAEAVRPLPGALVSRLEALGTEAGGADLDAPIEGEVSL